MPKLASIVLAAGASRRFGADNKLLAPFEGQPLIARVVARVREGAGPEIIVVTGADSPAIAAALSRLNVRIAANANWQQGIGTSIATGVGALAPDIDAAFIVPGDMPFLEPEMLRRLACAFARAEGGAIVYPATLAGEQRNPVLWPRRFFSGLATLSGQAGAKQLLAANTAHAIALPCPDERAFADIDTPADLDLAMKIARTAATLP